MKDLIGNPTRSDPACTAVPQGLARATACAPSKRFVFWNVSPCNSLKVNLLFGGAFSPHLQSENNRSCRWFARGLRATKQSLGLFVDSEDGGDMSFRNVC
jgi:hypothetical protein